MPLGYLDDASNPSMYTLPDQADNLWGAYVGIKLYVNGAPNSDTIGVQLNRIADTAPPLCTTTQDSPLIQSYELS